MILLNKFTYISLFIFISAFFLGCTKDEPSDIQKNAFIKSFGGAYENEAIDMIKDGENYYLLGNENDEDGQSNIVVIKTDDFGNRIWEVSYVTDDNPTQANQIIKLEHQDGFAIIGSMEIDDDSLYYDAYILVIDNNGNTLWDKTYNNLHSELGKCIAELDDGGFIIAMSQDSMNSSNSHMNLFTRLNSQGELIPNGTSKTPGTELFQIYKNTNNKGFYITCHNNSIPEVIILNPDGTLVAPIKFDISGKIFSITQDINENIFICGEKNNGLNGGKDGFIAQLESIGSIDFKWMNEFGNSKDDYFKYITITDESQILATGSIEDSKAISDIWILKTNINGQLISESKLGGDNNEYGVRILESEDKRFIVEGTTHFENSSFISIYKSEFE